MSMPETVSRMNSENGYVTVLKYSGPAEVYEVEVSLNHRTPFMVYRDSLKEAIDVAFSYCFQQLPTTEEWAKYYES